MTPVLAVHRRERRTREIEMNCELPEGSGGEVKVQASIGLKFYIRFTGNKRADMHRIVTVIGIVVLLLLLNSTLAYIINEGIEVADVSDLTKQYYTVWKFYNILGVRVKVELTGPMLLVHGEKSTFTYKILVGDAPSGWSLNITEVALKSGCFWHQPYYRYVQKLTKVLKGGESLTGQFTVNSTMETWRYYPGASHDCDPTLYVEYRAEFGANQVKDRMYLDYFASYDGNNMLVRMKAKELPLEIEPRISSVGIQGSSISIRGEIIIRNNQNWDMILTKYERCISKGLWPRNCYERKFPASTIIKSGGEYILKIDETVNIHLSGGNNPPFYVTYIIRYLYPGGYAENWLTLRVVRPFSGAEAQVTRQETKSPTTVTGVVKSPTTTATTAITTTTRPTVPLGGAPIGPGTPTYMDTFFGVLMLMVPIALVTIAGVAIAAYSTRKSRTIQSRPKAEETAQGPSEPTAQSPTQTSTQRTEPPPPTSQEETQSQTTPPSQPEQPKPPQPKLQTPAWLDARSKAIISKLASAKARIELGDLNDAILEIHKAVNATISLILEAEGLSMKGPNGKELKMTEKFRLIAERGWVSWNHRRYFIRLQNLRNRIEHDPERIHAPQTTASEVQELFRFHENFVRTSLRTLEELGSED
jgi:hypothetical protein